MAGKCALGGFMILCGYEHFLYTDFVASLIPPWIPWHVFWTYFAGVALIAGGVGISLRRRRNSPPGFPGMILSWVPLVHIPLALRDITDPGENVPVFEALAFGSAAVLAAATRARTGESASPTLVTSRAGAS